MLRSQAAMRGLLLLSVLLGLTGCPPAENPFVCTADCDAGRADSGVMEVDAGPADSGAGDAGCPEAWVCSGWNVSDAGIASRTCTEVNGCGTTALKPPVGPAPLPSLDFSYFKCEVQPVLERGCGMLGCHGTQSERDFQLFSRGRLRNSEQVPQVSSCLGSGMLDLAIEGTGTVMCLGWSRLTATEWKKNFDNARTFSIGVTAVANNELLTQPLQGNARAHAGIKLFALNDPSYTKLRSWLAGATAPADCDAGFN